MKGGAVRRHDDQVGNCSPNRLRELRSAWLCRIQQVELPNTSHFGCKDPAPRALMTKLAVPRRWVDVALPLSASMGAAPGAMPSHVPKSQASPRTEAGEPSAVAGPPQWLDAGCIRKRPGLERIDRRASRSAAGDDFVGRGHAIWIDIFGTRIDRPALGLDAQRPHDLAAFAVRGLDLHRNGIGAACSGVPTSRVEPSPAAASCSQDGAPSPVVHAYGARSTVRHDRLLEQAGRLEPRARRADRCAGRHRASRRWSRLRPRRQQPRSPWRHPEPRSPGAIPRLRICAAGGDADGQEFSKASRLGIATDPPSPVQEELCSRGTAQPSVQRVDRR